MTKQCVDILCYHGNKSTNAQYKNGRLQGPFRPVAKKCVAASIAGMANNQLNTHYTNDRLQGPFRPVAKECVAASIASMANDQTHTTTMTGYRVDFDQRVAKNVLLSIAIMPKDQ